MILFSQETSKCFKGTPQYLSKKGISLRKYLILQKCLDQNTDQINIPRKGTKF